MRRWRFALASAITLVAWALGLASCDSGVETTPLGDGTPQPGAITLHFTNSTSGPIYVNETLGPSYGVTKGSTTFSGPHDCTPSCTSGCECAQCGAPLPQVRRIPAGQAYDYVWSGDYWNRIPCGSGATCACDDPHWAPFGTYRITLSGAPAYDDGGGSTNPNDPDLLQGALNAASGTCSATKVVTLAAAAATVEIPFSCSVP